MATPAEMEAFFAVVQVKARYCRLLDTKDWAGWTELFTEDFELDVSDGTGLPVLKGREAAVASVRASIETARTAHQVHAPEIRLDGADTVHAIFPMQDRVIWGAGGAAARTGPASLTGFGHYHERYLRQDGRWRIAASRLTRLILDIVPG